MAGFNEIEQLAADLVAAAVSAQVKAVLVVAQTARALETIAQRRAPRVTGDLARSITTTVNPFDVSAEVGPEEYYGYFVEYGTSKMGPQPFMGPAADEVAPDFAAAMEELGADLL